MAFENLGMTRRGCGQMLAGITFCGILPVRGVSDTGSASGLSWGEEPAADIGRERRYRAHVQILLLSLPLVRWANVGGGRAVWRETATASRDAIRLLEFTGFSSPEHAGGLNRLGFIRELSRVAEEGATEALYLPSMAVWRTGRRKPR